MGKVIHVGFSNPRARPEACACGNCVEGYVTYSEDDIYISKEFLVKWLAANGYRGVAAHIERHAR